MVDGECLARDDVLVVYIGGHADDAARSLADIDKVHHRIGPHDVVIDGILPREHALCDGLADDHNRFTAAAIIVIEVAPRKNGHAESGEESWRNDAKLRAWILLSRAFRVTFSREIEARTKAAGVAPGNSSAERDAIHAGHFVDTAD